MKKRRFIAGVLVLSMLLMGTGYAYWTDKLTINTTVDTGKLDVQFLDTGLYGAYGYSGESGWSIINGVGSTGYLTGATDLAMAISRNDTAEVAKGKQIAVENAKNIGNTKTTGTVTLEDPITKLVTAIGNSGYVVGTNTSSSVKIELKDMYPGYAQVFRTDVANVGTLSAKLSEVKTVVTGDTADTLGALGIAIYVHREQVTTGTEPKVADVYTSLSTSAINSSAGANQIVASDFFTVGNVKFLRLSSISKLNTMFDGAKNVDTLYIHPDTNRFDVYFAVAMDPDATGEYTTGSAGSTTAKRSSDITTQDQDATITVDFLWDQFNEGKVIDPLVNNIVATQQKEN